MSEAIPEIPDTPEGMFPDDFGVYTNEDAAHELLRAGDALGAAEMLIGLPEPLGFVEIPRQWDAHVEFNESASVLERIDKIAEAKGISREAMIRYFIRHGLMRFE